MPARAIYGDNKPVRVKTTASTVTKHGDLGALVTGAFASAAAFPWTTDLPTTQAAFHTAFAGSALDDSPMESNLDILVNTSGVHSYPCAALGSAAALGAFVGPAKDTGNNLANQLVAIVADAPHAIGRLVEAAPVGATTLKFELTGTITLGGPQVPA